jgi:hypothetical protein
MFTTALTREWYHAFQRVQLDRWDAITTDDVVINSPAGFGLKGREALKSWAAAFAGSLGYRIDLVDEHLALDDNGDGRGFITLNLHWKHDRDFMGIAPTGREGTSVVTLLLTIKARRILRIDVADNTLDLALYLWERGWPHVHNVVPQPLISGLKRSHQTHTRICHTYRSVKVLNPPGGRVDCEAMACSRRGEYAYMALVG